MTRDATPQLHEATGAAALRAPVLRPARAADVELVARLERTAFGDPWSRDAFAQLVRNPEVFFHVAANDAPGGATLDVCGYVVAWFVLDEGEIANLAVAPASRARGLGARLLDTALAEGARRGVVTMFLEVRESNVPARRLYASRGFVEVGRRRGYYRHPLEDALVLRREAPPR